VSDGAADWAIVTARLVLRALRADDLPAFAAYRADPAVARFQGWEAGYTQADAERLLAAQRDVTLGRPGSSLQIAVADRADDVLLGDCYVRICVSPPATAEIGVTLAPSSQGRGMAAEALRALVGALFERHGLHRLFAEADDRNAAVHRLLERLGFRCEARLVEEDWFKGERTTLRVYGLLAREWPAR
jgi:RimJ/RimL family protein N-acetyltransferase